jgi:hypothetical protein
MNSNNLQDHHAANNRYQIQVLSRELTGPEFALYDHRVLGRQIAQVSGHVPVDNAIVLHRREGRPLTVVPLDELVDLRHDRVTQFVVGDGDRTFFFFINGERWEWAWKEIRASVVLELAGAGSGIEVLLEKVDVPDQVLHGDELVDLGGEGIERFVTRPATVVVVVTYNSSPFKIKTGRYTTEQLKAIFRVEAGYALDLIPTTGPFQMLSDGQSIMIVAGLVFASVAPTGSSS